MQIDTEVLVIGAGPVGLALAGDLGWRGKRSIVADRSDGVIGQPKMDLVGIRTMEYCRRWNIVADVEASPYDRDYPQDNVFLTSLNGYELERQPMPSMGDEQPPPESPQKRERCPQNMFDPILRKFAESQLTTSLLYQHEFVSFEEDEDGVTAHFIDLTTNTPKAIRARYLVGCDGGKSAVREQLGIEMNGGGLLTHTTNTIFRCPGFNQLHDKAPGYRYMFVGPKGTWATIVAINGKDQWRMSIIGNKTERPRYTHDELKALAHKCMGHSFEMEILSVLRWTRTELVADKYHAGRVFICGDACHLTSPTGGLGMNTGIGDAVGLSWMLSAALEGWGGDGLFDAYEIERRPIAQRIISFSTKNLQTMRQVPASDRLDEDSPAGADARTVAGRALAEGLKSEWFSMNIHLGNRYTASPVIVYSEPEDPAANAAEFDDAMNYRPTSRPGCRAPHIWLDDGRSMLDLFGRSFVLLEFGQPDGATVAFAKAAQDARIPLQVTNIQQPEAVSLYEQRYVLVRPDGHVAWRGNQTPGDIAGLLATVTGHKGQAHETV